MEESTPRERAQETVYLGVCEAARLLGIAPDSVRRRIARGQLAAVRDAVSRRYRIPRTAVLAQLEEVRPVTLPALFPRPLDPWTRAELVRTGLIRHYPGEG